MSILIAKTDIDLLPKPNEYQLIQDNRLPPLALVTAVLGLVFDGDKFLMTQLSHRGWDIPGGHVENGELPEDTLRREIYEETAVRIHTPILFAYDQFTIHAPMPPGYKYPYPVSYQLFYLCQIDELDDFHATEEALARKLFSPNEARQTDWVQRLPELYETALTKVIT